MYRHYDTTPGAGPQLLGRAVTAQVAQRYAPQVISALAMLLSEDAEATASGGWCMASANMLHSMFERGLLSISVFRQARTHNDDMLSSLVDESQPATDNTWALVAYQDDAGGYYTCVLQVICFARVSVRSNGQKGFHPDLCQEFGVQPPPANALHCAQRFAVGHLWLATACGEAEGALGCRVGYDPHSGMAPDLVGVTNLSQTGRVVQGSGAAVLNMNTRSRYYGTCGVRVEDICCQVGMTHAQAHDKLRCFLVTSKQSGKRR